MNLAQGLQQAGAIDSIARELGIDPAAAQQAAGALLPAIVAGMGRTAVAPQAGAGGGLAEVLRGSLGGGLLDSILKPEPTPAQPGNEILGHIFGSKDVSRGVAEEVSGSTGLPPDLLKKMLPMLAMAVVGYMMKNRAGGSNAGEASGGGMLGGALGGILSEVVTGMLRR
ncbi:hypothetical protein GCM10011515_16990 [Tsuneonella deserti]|uniref:DUF937 domain-containing protein n=1 Tax=Tsuneonella deserti TaxID=2035528 RepID=A0ABQ1SAN4_9SPHN|nr:DUF937 domain-containing protein [Tsuneonella deserti]GGD97839.1 hypothetical protein GCM10011515_16990 [Tsuneonella deserti]